SSPAPRRRKERPARRSSSGTCWPPPASPRSWWTATCGGASPTPRRRSRARRGPPTASPPPRIRARAGRPRDRTCWRGPAGTSGPGPPNPPALLARKQTVSLLQELRRRFEWVIVDSPPLASVTDAQLLSRYADACIFVIRYDRVSKAIVRRTVQALRKSGANLLGVVLNAVETPTRGYAYQYDYYYREPETKPAENGTLARWFALFRGSAGDRAADAHVEPDGPASKR